MRKFYLLVVFTAIILISIYYGSKFFVAPEINSYSIILLNQKGDSIPFSEFHGKVILLNFYASWCGSCLREFPSLNYIENKYRNNNFKCILITDENWEKINENIITFNLFPNVFKVSQTLEKIGIFAYPTTYLIDKNGEIKHSFVGEVDWNLIENQKLIEDLINQ
jgi:thiol-disulfide isomerase/thioredoxin